MLPVLLGLCPCGLEDVWPGMTQAAEGSARAARLSSPCRQQVFPSLPHRSPGRAGNHSSPFLPPHPPTRQPRRRSSAFARGCDPQKPFLDLVPGPLGGHVVGREPGRGWPWPKAPLQPGLQPPQVCGRSELVASGMGRVRAPVSPPAPPAPQWCVWVGFLGSFFPSPGLRYFKWVGAVPPQCWYVGLGPYPGPQGGM